MQNTHAHVVFDIKKKMVPVDSKEKQKLGMLNYIIREHRGDKGYNSA